MLPDYIRDGFHRDDHCPAPRLSSNRPALGQNVKLNVNLTRPLTCKIDKDDPTAWVLMAGHVNEVLGNGRVAAVVEVATTPAPDHLLETRVWRAVLEHDADYQHPWVLIDLEPWRPN